MPEPETPAAPEPESPPAVGPEDPPPPPPTPEGTISAWSSYSKDRFEAASKRIDEFRNWARQLAGVIGVVIGFELTLIGRALDLKSLPPTETFVRGLALLVLLVTIGWQAWLLSRVLQAGYSGRTIVGPESPSRLATFVAALDESATKQLIGAYYAKAYDEFFQVGEELAQRVASLMQTFSKSLGLLLAGLIFLAWVGGRSYTSDHVAGSPTPSPAPSASPATPAATPSASTPAPAATSPATPAPSSPLLVTPTAGQPATFTALPTTASPKKP